MSRELRVLLVPTCSGLDWQLLVGVHLYMLQRDRYVSSQR